MYLAHIQNWAIGTKLARNSMFLSLGFIGMIAHPETLVYLADGGYLESVVADDHISAVITTAELAPPIMERCGKGVLISDHPKKCFYQCHNHLARETDFYGAPSPNKISESADIHKTAVIGKDSVEIGAGTIVGPNAVILGPAVIGQNCYIGPGVVIGERGFQYCRDSQETFYVEHVGRVFIGDNVDILANSCIIQGLFQDTVLCSGVKLDTRTHIAHGVRIGENTLITSGTCFGGSVTVGKNVWIGLNATVRHDIEIKDGAFIGMASAVTQDVPAGEKVAGNFAIQSHKWSKFVKELAK